MNLFVKVTGVEFLFALSRRVVVNFSQRGRIECTGLVSIRFIAKGRRQRRRGGIMPAGYRFLFALSRRVVVNGNGFVAHDLNGSFYSLYREGSSSTLPRWSGG